MGAAPLSEIVLVCALRKACTRPLFFCAQPNRSTILEPAGTVRSPPSSTQLATLTITSAMRTPCPPEENLGSINQAISCYGTQLCILVNSGARRRGARFALRAPARRPQQVGGYTSCREDGLKRAGHLSRGRKGGTPQQPSIRKFPVACRTGSGDVDAFQT